MQSAAKISVMLAGLAGLGALVPGATAIAASAAPLALGDETLFFQEIPSVYGASKYDQKITEAPSSVSIVTAAEIKRYGYRTLADALRSLRGFTTSYDRNYVYASVRGFGQPGDYNTRILVLVDGIRVNDNIFDTGAIGNTFPVDVDLIERVEFIRGPASSIYGTSAFFGVVNVVTKRGRDYGGVEVSGEAGTFDTYKGRLTGGYRFQAGAEVLLSGTVYRSRGDDDLYYPEFDDPATNNGRARNDDADRFEQIFGKATLGDFTLEGFSNWRRKEIPTAPWGVAFDDDRNVTWDNQYYLDLKYDHAFADLSRVTARATYGRYWYDGNYVYDYGDETGPDLVLNKDRDDGRWVLGEVQYLRTWFDTHKVNVGGEVRRNFRQDQRTFAEGEVFLDSDESSTVWALFAQDEWRIRDNLRLSLGVRHDDYSTFGGSTSPRLALVWNPAEKTALKALYGTAFRAPNAYELYYHDGPFTQKAPGDLDPETIRTYELVWEQYLGDHLRGVLSGFYYEIEDLIVFTEDPGDLTEDGVPLLVFANRGGARAKGIEAELEGKWPGGVEGRISYSYQLATDEDSGAWLVNSPRHLAKLNLGAPLFTEYLHGGLEVQYTSERKTFQERTVDGFWVTNLTLFHSGWFEGLEVSASVYNLFDEEYEDPGSAEHAQNGIEQDGRTYRLKLSYLF